MASRAIFVGRANELATLARLEAPLVTLWGPGGAGKTTLARAHADRVRANGGTIVWADLALARTRSETLAVLATALGVENEDAIAHAAEAQRAVVIADNVEQLDDDARAVLLDLSIHARVIATSRSPLAVPNEHVIEVGPLPDAEALELLEARAGATVESSLARAIVERLDRLPLAIELAAARVPLLGAEEVLSRIRQPLEALGLRARIEWSWDLLEDHDRDALRACATFEAPFDAVLAERVVDRPDALDRLERLRTRALLRTEAPDARGRPSLRLLEAVRELAREKTAADDPVHARHARAIEEHTLPLAETVLRGGAVPPELERRRADLVAIARRGSEAGAFALAALLSVTGPVDAAVDVCRAAPQTARIVIALADALRSMGDLHSAEEALAKARTIASGALELATLHRAAGSVARSLGDLPRALAEKEKALSLARAANDVAREGLCLGEIGAVHQSEGRFSLAKARHAEAIAIHVAMKSRRAEGIDRSFLAVATHRSGEPQAALALHEEALAIHREVGHRRLEGAELLHLGWVRHEIGDPGAARTSLSEARSVLAAAGARGLEALAIVLLARLAVDEGDTTTASIHLAEARRITPKGWPRLEATTHLVAGHLALARGDASAARTAYEAALAASDAVEVGFEALTPAYLAVAPARSEDPALDPAALFARARSFAARFENPTLVCALDVLEGRVHAPSEAMLRASSDVRRALAFRGVRGALVVADDGKRVVLPDGRAVDLAKRKNVRLILIALAEARRGTPGKPLDSDALVAAGWPGEKMKAEAAQKRLHTAIWTLRSLGLEELLKTEDGGYFLDPAVPLQL